MALSRTILPLLFSLSLFVDANAAPKTREGTEWDIAYWYNANDNKLPRVLLLGDSICNGYQSLVRDELAGTAYVSFWATSKCGTDRSYLKQLSYILEEYDYSVIHFNNGLHSLNTDVNAWETGLRNALNLIKEKGKGAKVIWATSTPLRDPALTEKAKQLNSAAETVMKEAHIPTDDLFSLMDPLDRAKFWTDTYHYTPEGKKIQAHQVAEMIRSALGSGTATPEAAKAALKAAASETGPNGKLETVK
ncbi:MAG: SGNH/GDSL hydrolase family protein [Verrucomicrobiota bacterium]